jgi:hypothetical protein
MALFRHVGEPVTIAKDATHYWEYWFDSGRDVGVTTVTPNLLEGAIGIELIAFDQGVVEVPGEGENPPGIHYTVRIRNAGKHEIVYDLNVGVVE